MATLEQIGEALKRAHAAGDTDAAAKLAQAYRAMSSAEQPVAEEEVQLTNQQKYDAALQNFRQAQYPDFTDEEFARVVEGRDLQPADIGDLARNGLLLGFGDEISSLVDALGSQFNNWTGNPSAPNFAEAFANRQALEDAKFNVGREQQGMLGTAAELGGSLATFGPVGAGINSALQGGTAVAPSLLKTTATSGGTGAILGAIGGASNAQGGLPERAHGAVEGAVGGAVLGAAFPLVARGVGSAWDNAAQYLSANAAARDIGISPDAARFLSSRFQADDAASPEGIARILAAGQEGMLADAGRSARNTLDYAIQSSGGAGRIAKEAIDARVTRDSGAIQQALDGALGSPAGVQGLRESARTGTAAQRGEAYKAAYGQPIDYSSPAGLELEALLQRVDPSVIRRANSLMRTRGEKSSQIIAEIGDNGEIVYRSAPDVRQIDYITRALNEEAEAGIGMGALGGQTALGAALQDLSREIRDTLRTHIPEYDVALNVGREAIQTSRALQDGYNALRPSVTREQVAASVRNLSPEDRAAYAAGIRSQIDDALSNVTRTVMDGDVDAREALKALRDLSSRSSREKVATVIGDEAADDLFRELDRATQSFELRASVADNSKTFQRQEMSRQVDSMVNPDGILGALGRGEPVNAGKRAVSFLTGMTPERALAAKDAIMTDVARALLSQGPDAIRNMQSIIDMNAVRQGASSVADALVRAGSRVGAASSYQLGSPTGNQLGVRL